MIKSEIICDSVNPAGVRLTTFALTYPRFIHSEFMTHRQISRNAASSRAIPIEKMISAVREAPALPERWDKNQKGMQAVEMLDDKNASWAEGLWLGARLMAMQSAKDLSEGPGVHKQIANRVLEPFSHITVVATASSWTNFFALRAHPMAQPEFQVLAFRMLDAYLKAAPMKLEWGAWHLPFIRPIDCDDLFEQSPDNRPPIRCGNVKQILAEISAARCARVSYLTHDGVRAVAKDLELYDKLVGSKPLHASALEHPALAIDSVEWRSNLSSASASNFDPSWLQLRKMVKGENVTELNLSEVMARKPDWIKL